MRTNYKILHLEDNAFDAELIQTILINAGFTPDITLVNTRNDFLSSFKVNTYDLILCDYNLPGYDGLQALKEIRSINDEIPYIFISGNIGEDRAIDSLKNGATDYILKDRLARLPSAVERAMREHKERKEKQEIDEALRSQEQFLLKVIETIPVLLTVKDKDGKILLANKMAETFYGMGSGQLVGKTENELTANDKGREQKNKDEQELFSGTQAVNIPDDRCIHPVTGKIYHFHTVKVPLYDSTGAPYHILTVSSDITDRKKMEEDLLRSERIHNIGALAGGIAHDLNNVLSPILLVVEVLRMRMTDEPTLRMLKMVEETAKRGSNLIKQVLSFARGTEGEKIVFQLKHVIDELEKIIKQTFPKSIQFDTAVTKNLWTMFGDVTQMHQVLMNLFVNARDAMPLGGTLSLKAENIMSESEHQSTAFLMKNIKYIKISVSDSGVGIPQEKISKIFEPFFTTKGLGKGTGLGLSTVKTIVENHSGYIDVKSIEGSGTTFTLYFPSSEAEPVIEKKSNNSGTPLGHGETILVVDDESAVREMIKSTLESSGYAIITASDGSEAIATYFQHKESLKAIITDMMMPIMNGKVLVETIRKANPNIKILGMSGSIEMKVQEITLNSLDIAILQKPFTVEQLLVSIDQLLQGDARKV